jgi:hypothetical protein
MARNHEKFSRHFYFSIDNIVLYCSELAKSRGSTTRFCNVGCPVLPSSGIDRNSYWRRLVYRDESFDSLSIDTGAARCVCQNWQNFSSLARQLYFCETNRRPKFSL